MEENGNREGQSEVPREEGAEYRALIKNNLDRLGRSEMAPVVRWYQEFVARLPEMTVTDTALTGKGGWGKEMTPSGEVKRITGSYFDIPGKQVSVTRPDGSTTSWNQPGIVQKESPITLPTPEGEVTVKTSGFVGLLRDPEGNILLTVGQEPLAMTDKKALVRTPFQTSTTKLEAVLSGDRQKDPNLAGVLYEIAQGRPIKELFASGAIETFPLAPADPNRISATNMGFVMEVADPAIRAKLAADGSNRWCKPAEIKALIRAGIVNGHTAAAYAAA